MSYRDVFTNLFDVSSFRVGQERCCIHKKLNENGERQGFKNKEKDRKRVAKSLKMV
jgi:hypothetical protein